MITNRDDWNVAVDGISGWFCKGCGHGLSWLECEQLGHTLAACPLCDTKWDYKTMGVKVLESDVKFFDTKTVYETTWFHASGRSDWLENVSNAFDTPVIHLGSKEAAQDRARAVEHGFSQFSDIKMDTWDWEEGWKLYELRILPDAYISGRVWKDVDTEFPYTVDELLNSKYGADVVRYVNSWEAPGSISLLVNPQKVQIVRVTDLKT